MSIQILGMMLLYMVISSFTPGPGNILALNTMISKGWKAGKYLLLGIAMGYLTVQGICTIAIYGMSEYLSPALNVMKYVGAAYLIWLAIHIMLSKPDKTICSGNAGFCTGFVMQLVNVKIYFYIITLLTAYIQPAFSELWQMLLMGIFVVAVGCTATLTWAFLGLRLQ